MMLTLFFPISYQFANIIFIPVKSKVSRNNPDITRYCIRINAYTYITLTHPSFEMRSDSGRFVYRNSTVAYFYLSGVPRELTHDGWMVIEIFRPVLSRRTNLVPRPDHPMSLCQVYTCQAERCRYVSQTEAGRASSPWYEAGSRLKCRVLLGEEAGGDRVGSKVGACTLTFTKENLNIRVRESLRQGCRLHKGSAFLRSIMGSRSSLLDGDQHDLASLDWWIPFFSRSC